MKLRLYHYWRSSSSWRVRWALSLKKIPCEFVAVDLLSGEVEAPTHLNRNPMGYVPVLEFLDRPSSDRFLAESMAIMEWIEEMVPSPSLIPGDPYQRAKIRQLAETINAGTQPLQNLNPQHLHSEDPEKQKAWARHWIQNGLAAYEKILGDRSGRFSVGDSVTLADLCLVPQGYNAVRFDVSLTQFPKINKIVESALLTPACQDSHPDRFKP